MNLSLCPECGDPAEPLDSKYAGRLCDKCLLLVEDSNGRRVECFLTNPPHNGFIAYYTDTEKPLSEKCDEVTDLHRVWLNGNKYTVSSRGPGDIVAYPGFLRC